MRWLSFSQNYAVNATGGTEVFVHRLNRFLASKGFEVHATFYRGEGGQFSGNDFEGIPLHPMPLQGSWRSRLDGWALRPAALKEFGALVGELKPDVVHFHNLSSTVSPDHILLASRTGSKTLLTYHSPGQSCQRWDLLYNGRDLCDGRIEVERCTECCLRRGGLPQPAARFLSRWDLHKAAAVLPGKYTHPLERRRGLELYQARWQEAMEAVDAITYHSAWVKEMLLRNGVPEDKLFALPLPPPVLECIEPRDDLWKSFGKGTLRLLYVGRLSDIKGVHVLIEAVMDHLHGEDLGLLLLGAEGTAAYQKVIEGGIEADPRIRLLPPQDERTTLGAIAAADAVVIPSIWPETGPYTALEAQWAGVSVIASDRAGLRERLQSYAGGHLFPVGDSRALADSIVELRRQARGKQEKRGFDRASYRRRFDDCLTGLISQLARQDHTRGLPAEMRAQ